jgi:hypothetical protein
MIAPANGLDQSEPVADCVEFAHTAKISADAGVTIEAIAVTIAVTITVTIGKLRRFIEFSSTTPPMNALACRDAEFPSYVSFVTV